MRVWVLIACSLIVAAPLLAQAQYDFAAEAEELAVPGETVQQAADKTAQVLRNSRMKVSISTVGFDIRAGSEAENWLKDTARIGGGAYFTASDSGQLAQALGSAASGQTGTTTVASNAVMLTQPRENDVVGPNIDIIGRADPTQVVVIYTIVFDAATGEKLRTVPGIRNRPKETGDFTFRIATPRVSFGMTDNPPPLRYELHAHTVQPDGTKGPEVIVNLFAPKTK